MDKESLSICGWIVIVAIIIASFIAFVTPYQANLKKDSKNIIYNSIEQKTGTNENILNLDSSGLEK